jgi:hypothetical protein
MTATPCEAKQKKILFRFSIYINLHKNVFIFVRSASLIRIHIVENVSRTIWRYNKSIKIGWSNVSMGEKTLNIIK